MPSASPDEMTSLLQMQDQLVAQHAVLEVWIAAKRHALAQGATPSSVADIAPDLLDTAPPGVSIQDGTVQALVDCVKCRMPL